MANSEVTVSMEEVVMVKTEDEGDPDDDASKTQVILQLQPITAEEDSGEIDAAVMAVEANPEETLAEGEELEMGYPITCGDSKAVLLVKKFVCPGINVKCVKYEDQLISPKQFVHMSGKATLKDWKRAIRMGGVMLRKMMDSGQLDFYEHSTLCTNTCRSTKFDLLITNARMPPDGSGMTPPTSSQAQILMGNGGHLGEERAEVLTSTVEWSSVAMDGPDKKEASEISEDTLNFWKGIADVGLMGEVVTNISTELLEMLRGVQLRGEQAAMQDAEVAVLSNLAQVFGLLDSVKRILGRRRHQTNPSQEQVLSTLTNLEQQLEEQRKQQQVRSLLANPQPSKKASGGAKRQAKRPRLQRPASTTTLLTSPVCQQAALQPQQFTVLSPITISPMGHPFTMSGLPMASLGQGSNTVTLLPAGSQLFARYMVGGDGKGDTFTLHPSSGLTLVGTANMQDPGQLGTMVSPMELVQLTQQAGGNGVAQVMDGTVLVQEEVTEGGEVVEEEEEEEESRGHAVIEITEDDGGGAMVVQGDVEMAVVAEEDGEEAERQLREVQVAAVEGVQGLQLDANGQLADLHIVVIGENAQVISTAK
ncbi:glucocorticoid modulatory element-binding protein 1 [Aplochiton taeniatus]